MKRRRRLAVLLALVAGGVDAIGYVFLFELFTAHMTGNTVAFAVNAAHGDLFEALRRAFPIPMFVAGVALGAVMSKGAARQGRRATYALVFTAEAIALVALLVAGSIIDRGTSAQQVTPGYFALAGLSSGAMGLQSSTLRSIRGHGVRTTFVTGILTTLAEETVTWAMDRKRSAKGARRAARRARLVLAIWTAYAGSGIAFALLQDAIGLYALFGPLALLGAVLVVDVRAARIQRDEAPVPA